jgi:hypothetical protein
MNERDKHSSLLRGYIINYSHKMFHMKSSGGCMFKHFIAIINSVTMKASVFVKTNEKCLTITKALAYYTMELITVVKCFM